MNINRVKKVPVLSSKTDDVILLNKFFNLKILKRVVIFNPLKIYYCIYFVILIYLHENNLTEKPLILILFSNIDLQDFDEDCMPK